MQDKTLKGQTNNFQKFNDKILFTQTNINLKFYINQYSYKIQVEYEADNR
jgi:hypothetical protein